MPSAPRRGIWQDAAMKANPHLAGIGFGLLAYGIWGFFPLYFR